jgi:protein-disulfide isomerase
VSTATLTPDVNHSDHVDGPANAPVTLVQYGDFECPYCGAAYPIVKELGRRFGEQIRFVFRHFPLSEAHPHAEHAAEAAEAVAELGGEDDFWVMHDMLYENQDALEDEDLVGYATEVGVDGNAVARALDAGTYRTRVRADFKSGIRSGVNGTPSFFINGVRFDGEWSDVEEFAEAIQSAESTTISRGLQ